MQRVWYGLMCLGMMGASNTMWAQNNAGNAVVAPAVDSQSPNALTTATVQRGMLSCAARVQQVTQFVGFGPQAGAILIPPPAPADRNLFSTQIEVPAGAQGNSFIDASFAPNQANGCGATYSAVSYWTQPCDAVANQQFASLKRMQALKRDVAVLDGGPATKVFLLRAGDTGCISIKKEIVL